MKPLKICIDARLVSGNSGGVEQFVIGLATGLSKLTDGPEEYLFLAYADSKEWLVPFLRGSCRILEDENAPMESLGERLIKRSLPGLINLRQNLNPLLFRKSIRQSKSNGLIEKEGVDVMHFTYQNAFMTDVPSIYHPHDLQHIHLPGMFPLRQWVMRDQMFRSFIHQANVVAVASQWVKRDLIEQYHLPDDKIIVVALAPVNSAYSRPDAEGLADIQRKYSLPTDFIFYPAQTWPHKNHIGLLKALVILRERMNMKIHAVFSGRKNQYHRAIENSIKKLGLEDQVTFLGFVSPEELCGLYNLSRCVVIPTRFEAASFPLWEAFVMGVPVACSNVTSLPEQAGDSALLFDPDRPEDIAFQIRRLWTDEKLRSELVVKGRQKVSHFSWERTARTFRAHYRRIAQRALTDEDLELLIAPPLF